ncbi:MAG: prephenate dehydrogenase/arogenate dehydrogenase family protein, partial [Hyphomicrobiales bacterium]|nr:prephenate dehydrogenase/arogenate dehydrogenase family protein [Hyphomicrobiales bacterium]
MPDRLGHPLEKPLFDQLTLIGVGLIGSSLARVARRQNLAKTIIAIDSSEEARKKIAALQLADHVTGDYADGVKNADCVILCVPVGACGLVAEKISSSLKAGAILSDVGSVKGAIVSQIEPHLPKHVHFVPAHPV